MYLSPKLGKYITYRVLSYTNKISSNQQHQPERTFTIMRVLASAVMADTANKTAKRYVLLVEMLLNIIRFFIESSLFLFFCGFDRNLMNGVDEKEPPPGPYCSACRLLLEVFFAGAFKSSACCMCVAVAASAASKDEKTKGDISFPPHCCLGVISDK